jgi:transposase
MSIGQRYSPEFKAAIVAKLLSKGDQHIEAFSKENNLARSTVSRWKWECANVSLMKNKKNKSKISSENILKIIVETYSLTGEELGLYLRNQGLHSSQLEEWRKDIILSMSKPKLSLVKKDERDFRIKNLEKNLRKKDAALAEVSALLILQKKANLLWPDPIMGEAY